MTHSQYLPIDRNNHHGLLNLQIAVAEGETIHGSHGEYNITIAKLAM